MAKSPKGVTLPDVMPTDYVLVRDCDRAGDCGCIMMASRVLLDWGITAMWLPEDDGDLLFIHKDHLDAARKVDALPQWLWPFNVLHEHGD